MKITHNIQSDNQDRNNRICRGRIHPPSPRSPVAWLRRVSQRLDLRSQGYYGVGGRRGLHPALWILLAGLIIPSLLAAESRTFTLVKDGKPAATIVTAVKPLPGAQKAVAEFQYFLTRLTGTNLAVKTDAQPVEGPVVLIGASEALAKRGIKIDKLVYDNFIIRSGPDFLAIVGRDTEPLPDGGSVTYGTANGVYAFLEDYCGVRVFMPGENGIIAPRTTTLTIPANLDVAFQKSMLVGMVPFRSVDSILRQRWRSYPGLKLKTYGGHSWAPAFPATNYFAKHPEYYALASGKRIKSEGGSLCVSNPDVLQRKIEWVKEQLQDADLLEIGHPDSYGGSCPACECEKCVALGKTLGDRIYWFHKQVAEAIRAWNPSKKLLMISYGPTYSAAPDWKYPDNVIIELTDIKTIDSWKKNHNQFCVYVYYWCPYFFGFGPANSIREIIDVFAMYKRDGVSICYYCTQPLNWGLLAPQLYLDYRLRMNYDTDPQKILADFYAGLYGPAAGAMKAFFDCVDEAQNTPIIGAKKNSASRYLSRWPTARTDQALKLLDQAEAAAGNDTVIKGRIELSRVSIQYIRENTRIFELDRQYKKSGALPDLETLAKAIADREVWIDGILKKQTDGYYTKTLGLIDPFPSVYRKQGTLRDQVVYGKTAGSGLTGPFAIDFKGMIAFLRQHPKMEGVMLKADAAPKIDGILDEAIWTKAAKMGMFKNDGSAEAPVPTDIQLAYDQTAVYVAFTAHEPAMDKMEKQPLKVKKGGGEGADWEDCVEVFFGESGRDARKFVHMIVSFTGARYDGRFGFVTDDIDPLFHIPDHRWKGEWQSAVHLDPEKKQWTVELAIPWATMGFGEPKPGTRLQANFNRERWTEHPKEADLFSWSPTFCGFEDASRFGVVKLEP